MQLYTNAIYYFDMRVSRYKIYGDNIGEKIRCTNNFIRIIQCRRFQRFAIGKKTIKTLKQIFRF